MSIRLVDNTIASVVFSKAEYNQVFFFSLNKTVKIAKEVVITIDVLNAIYLANK